MAAQTEAQAYEERTEKLVRAYWERNHVNHGGIAHAPSVAQLRAMRQALLSSGVLRSNSGRW